MTEERDSNIGQEGIESIRIAGKHIDDLPIGQGNEAKAGLADAKETARMNSINTINAQYPKHRVDYLASRITECQGNITRINTSKSEQANMISEYAGHIKLCEHRDKEIDRLGKALIDGALDDKTHKAQLRILKLNFPPYNVEAMEAQIIQCQEAIERCDIVIGAENESIREFTDVMAQCRIRDTELAKYGAVAEGS